PPPDSVICRIPEDGPPRSPWRRLLEQLQLVHADVGADDTDTRNVSTRLGQTRDESTPHRIPDLRHHNGNRAGRLLGRPARLGPHRDQDIDPELDELREEVGEPLVSALLPAILNGNGLALDVAALAQALAEGVHIWPGRIADIANPRHRAARLRL